MTIDEILDDKKRADWIKYRDKSNAHRREYYQKHKELSSLKRKEYREKNREIENTYSRERYHKIKTSEKIIARRMVNNKFLRKGIKGLCSVCGKSNAEAHHDDYSKPYEIVWLCVKHHSQLHFSKYEAYRKYGYMLPVKG